MGVSSKRNHRNCLLLPGTVVRQRLIATMNKTTMKIFEDFRANFERARCVAPIAGTIPDLKNKPPNLKVPETLENLLDEISKTGVTGRPWKYVKPVFLMQLDKVMRWYNNKQPFDKIPEMPNCKKETFREIYTAIIQAADAFKKAPFTIQRLCELICRPELHYKRIDKFLRALEKNTMVVTTVDDMGRKSSGPEPDEVVLPLDKQLVIKQKLYWLFEWLHVPTPSSADSTQATNSSPTKPGSNPASNLKTSPVEKVGNGDQNINKYTSSSPALKTSQLPTSASSCQKSGLKQDTAVKHLSLSSDDSQASTSASSTPVKPTSKRSLTEDEEDERNDHKLNPNTKRVKIESCKEGVSDMVTPHSTTVRSSYEISNGPDRTGTVESISVDDSHSAAVVSDVTATESNSNDDNTDDCVTDPFTDDSKSDPPTADQPLRTPDPTSEVSSTPVTDTDTAEKSQPEIPPLSEGERLGESVVSSTEDTSGEDKVSNMESGVEEKEADTKAQAMETQQSS